MQGAGEESAVCIQSVCRLRCVCAGEESAVYIRVCAG